MKPSCTLQEAIEISRFRAPRLFRRPELQEAFRALCDKATTIEGAKKIADMLRTDGIPSAREEATDLMYRVTGESMPPRLKPKLPPSPKFPVLDTKHPVEE